MAENSKKSRVVAYDYIRILAVLGVILIHNIGLDLAISTDLQGTPIYTNLSTFRTFLSTANIIFIMLSGALLLQYREESFGNYISKRISKVAIPLVLYYIMYYLFGIRFGTINKMTVGELVHYFIEVRPGVVGASHLWMIYLLLVLYFFFYFMRYMLKDMPYKVLTQFVVVILILSCLESVILFGVTDILQWVMLGWCGVAVVGYWVTRPETRKYDNLLIILGIVALIVHFAVSKPYSESVFYLSNLSPVRFFMAIGVFSFFLKIEKHLKEIKVITILSKYSYGIILCHTMIISIIHFKGLFISSVMYKGAGLPVTLLEILLLSFVMSFVVDNTIVAFINWIFALPFKLKKGGQ